VKRDLRAQRCDFAQIAALAVGAGGPRRPSRACPRPGEAGAGGTTARPDELDAEPAEEVPVSRCFPGTRGHATLEVRRRV